MILNDVWKDTLLDRFTRQLDLSCVGVGALLFDNKDPLLLERWDQKEIRKAISSIPKRKFEQLLRHVVIEIDTSFRKVNLRKYKYTLRSILCYDDSTEEDNKLFLHMDGCDQILPIYPHVPEHVEMVRGFLQRRFFDVMKAAYPHDFSTHITYPSGGNKKYIFHINGNVFLDLIPYSWNDVRTTIGDGYDLYRPKLSLLHDEMQNFHILVLYNTLASVTFLLATRKEVYKDFNMMRGCICTPLYRSNYLFKRKQFKVTEFNFMVTVFDVDKVVNRLKYYPLVEAETPVILRIIKHHKNIQYRGEKNAIK